MRELSIFVFAFGLVGCGSKNNTCVPGMSAACACSDGSMGAQSCRGDGTYGACACGTSATGGNGSGGAGGGGGGGSSGGSSNGNSGGGSGGGGGGGTGGIGGGGGASTGSKRVFVTSTAYAPTVATNICNTVAQSANLGGTWVAWLSHMPNASNMTGADAIDVVMGTGPWLLLNGHVAFANHAQLATMPSEPVSLTERMTSLPSTDDVVWTGTGNGGQASGYDCYDWSTMSTQYSASYGHATGVNDWTLAGSYSCQATAHVYCFEQ